jgi:hypothetical protein
MVQPPRRAAGTEQPTNSKYKATFDAFMSFVHNQTYSREHEYTAEEKNSLTPDDVVRWMNVKTFGIEDPPIDANPVHARSSSLEFWKKAISFFMPNRLVPWNASRNEGNPTKSIDVNDLIRRVKKKEVRKQGVAPQSRRSMTEREFRLLHSVLRKYGTDNDIIWRFGVPALINYQFHLIARIDDATQILMDHVRIHNSFSNALKTKLNWSKNVTEERDAPWQIMLGCMDASFCVLVSIALWLEISLCRIPNAMLSPYLFCFSDDIMIPSGGQKAKVLVQTLLGQKIFRMNEFKTADDNHGEEDGGGGPSHLGSHSIRKFAATHTRKCGCTRDEKDIRGRWKTRKRVSDVYDDVELPYPDAKVANKLCIGGPCYYLLPGEDAINNGDNVANDTTMMTRTFILRSVVPNIRKRMSESCSLLFGKALLWYLYSNDSNDACSHCAMLTEMQTKVKFELNEILRAVAVNVDEPDFNPIQKVPVIVSGDEGTVLIEVIDRDLRVANAAGGGAARSTAIQEQLLAIQSSLNQLRRDVNDVKTNQAIDRTNTAQQFVNLNANVKRIGRQPGRMMMLASAAATRTRGGDNDNTVPVRAQLTIAGLSPAPKDLYQLWNEYQHGIGGRKPAKQFSQRERGQVKHTYSLRNNFWEIMVGLVRSGHTSEVAIDRIYAVYGAQTSVTNILTRIRTDRKAGRLNPNLQA